MWLMASAALAIDLPDPVISQEDTPVPGPYPPNWVNIEVTQGDRHYTVTAYCLEDFVTASLYCDGVGVDNPYIIERTHEDMDYLLVGVGHCYGYEDSETRIDLRVPALQEPLPGDMNWDGEVTVSDVMALIALVMSGH